MPAQPASLLPDIGRTYYGTFVFPTEMETLNATVTPVKDSSKRTITHSLVSITMRFLVSVRNSGRTLEQILNPIVMELQHPGKPFVYAGRGLPLRINVGGTHDVVFGPMPGVVRFEPDGAGKSCHLTWTVEVGIPFCQNAAYTGPMEFCFGLSYDVDVYGNTTRTYNGHIIVANNRSGDGRDIRDSADKYRPNINPDLIPGFRRIPGNFNLSEDKSRLDFTITDVQMGPNIPPPGMIDAQASHTLVSVAGKLGTVWNGTISATYELARNGQVTAADARDAFWRLVRDRINDTLSKLGATTIGPTGGG